MMKQFFLFARSAAQRAGLQDIRVIYINVKTSVLEVTFRQCPNMQNKPQCELLLAFT